MKKQLLTIGICAMLSANYLNAQIITTVAGNGTAGYTGDGGQATAAELKYLACIACNAVGNIYIADGGNNCVRMVTTGGIITTIAGNGTSGYTGDGGQATAAELKSPHGIAFDAVGNIYITDQANNRVRKVTTSGIISTVVGNGTQGYTGDGGLATAAELFGPMGIIFDSMGNMFIADDGNNCIRKVTTGGIISTIAGNGISGYSGDGGAATAAQLHFPDGLAFDATGNLYIADIQNNCIRKITTGGIISTVAGSGTAGFSGDGGAATMAKLHYPSGVTFDNLGNMYIADNSNNHIRQVNTSGIINTVAGNGTCSYSGDGGPAVSAELCGPGSIAFDASGNLYIGDQYNNRIRKVTNVQTTEISTFNKQNSAFSIYPNPTNSVINVQVAGNNSVLDIQVTDVLGNVLISTKEKNIDVSTLPSGIYFVRLGTATQKFIKQ